MTLTEALTVLKNQPAPDGTPFEVLLACGSTPLYLEKLLAAVKFSGVWPERRVFVRTGLFGDLAGTFEVDSERAKNCRRLAICARVGRIWIRVLGYRQLGGWGPASRSGLRKHHPTFLRAEFRRRSERLSGVPGRP